MDLNFFAVNSSLGFVMVLLRGFITAGFWTNFSFQVSLFLGCLFVFDGLYSIFLEL